MFSNVHHVLLDLSRISIYCPPLLSSANGDTIPSTYGVWLWFLQSVCCGSRQSKTFPFTFLIGCGDSSIVTDSEPSQWNASFPVYRISQSKVESQGISCTSFTDGSSSSVYSTCKSPIPIYILTIATLCCQVLIMRSGAHRSLFMHCC